MELPTYFIFCLRSANATLRAVQNGIKNVEEISKITRLPVDEIKEWDGLMSLGIGERA
jgi:hypothetical protein